MANRVQGISWRGNLTGLAGLDLSDDNGVDESLRLKYLHRQSIDPVATNVSAMIGRPPIA
jgi:hypothetical protein